MSREQVLVVPNTVSEIVKEYLKAHGYDGLYCPGECACDIDDLMMCCDTLGGGDPSPCLPGYKTACDCGDHDWHIGAVKECAQ